MELTHEISNGMLVVRPQDRIDSGSAGTFEERCAALIAEGPNKVVIDFSQVHYISSAGLRAILVVAKQAKSLGGVLTLCGLQGNVKEVMSVSGFDVLLGAHRGVADAWTALGS
ncbi:MAG: STAS domain-containing protein [Methylocystis sp.]